MMVYVIIPSFRLVVGWPLAFFTLGRAYYQLSVVLYSLFHAKYVRVFGLGRVWEGDESIVSSTAPLSACSRSLFLFPCENQPQLYQFLLFFQYLGTVLLALTMMAYKQSIYFTRRLIIRLSIFWTMRFDWVRNRYQVFQLNYSTGSQIWLPSLWEWKTLGTPLNNLNGAIIVENREFVNKAKAIIIVLHFFANKFKYLQFIKQCNAKWLFLLKNKISDKYL